MIVLIEIAEDSLQQIGSWPWPRRYHASMTHILKDFGARGIVFDMLFSEPSDSLDDGALQQALEESRNVFLAVASEKKGDETIWIHSLPEFQKNARGIGHINIQPDEDGTLRRIQPFLNVAGQTHPHLALQVSADILGEPLPSPRRLPFPTDPGGNLVINWAGKWKDTFTHYSYVDLLKSYDATTKGEKPLVDPDKIKGKICLIGLTAFGHADIKATPMEPAYPAVGVHANVINSLLTGQFIYPVGPRVNILCGAVLGLMVTLLFVQFRYISVFLAGLLAGVAWAVITFALFKTRGLLVATANPLSMIFCLYIFSTIFALFTGKKERLHLFRLATRDGLTGLYVIRHFRILMNQAVLEAQERKKPMALILIDIDHFKTVNDNYGHLVGDMVLREVARIIRANCREKRPRFTVDWIARYGGEEFIILLRNCKLNDALFVTAERLRKKVQEANFIWEGVKIPVTISLGVSGLRPGENIPDLMIRRADEALYRAKSEGRNRVCLEKS